MMFIYLRLGLYIPQIGLSVVLILGAQNQALQHIAQL